MPYEILLQHVSIVSCLCIFGISHFGLYYLYSSTNKRKYIFDEKKREYESIIIFAQIVLFPTEARYSLHVASYNIQELSNEQNRNNAINDLKMAIPKLKLISNDAGLVAEVDKFIRLQSEEQFNILVDRLRKDLYK